MNNLLFNHNIVESFSSLLLDLPDHLPDSSHFLDLVQTSLGAALLGRRVRGAADAGPQPSGLPWHPSACCCNLDSAAPGDLSRPTFLSRPHCCRPYLSREKVSWGGGMWDHCGVVSCDCVQNCGGISLNEGRAVSFGNLGDVSTVTCLFLVVVTIIVWAFPAVLHLCQGDYVFLTSVVCLLVSQQDYTRTDERISMKVGWRMALSPEQTQLTFSGDPNKGTDPGTLTSIECRRGGFGPMEEVYTLLSGAM